MLKRETGRDEINETKLGLVLVIYLNLMKKIKLTKSDESHSSRRQ
jgi:hypothetical protein